MKVARWYGTPGQARRSLSLSPGPLPLAGGGPAAPPPHTASPASSSVARSQDATPGGSGGTHCPWEAVCPPGEGWGCSISVTCAEKEELWGDRLGHPLSRRQRRDREAPAARQMFYPSPASGEGGPSSSSRSSQPGLPRKQPDKGLDHEPLPWGMGEGWGHCRQPQGTLLPGYENAQEEKLIGQVGVVRLVTGVMHMSLLILQWRPSQEMLHSSFSLSSPPLSSSPPSPNEVEARNSAKSLTHIVPSAPGNTFTRKVLLRPSVTAGETEAGSNK